MALDNINNTCLFGDNFEDKLLKNTNAKQNSKLIFSGLRRKSSTNSNGTLYNNQPFRTLTLPWFSASGRRGHFFRAVSQRATKNYSCIIKSSSKAGSETSSSTKSVSSGAEVRPTSNRHIKTVSRIVEKIDERPQILKVAKGYQILFSPEPKQTKSPNPVHLAKKEESLVDLESQAMLRKGAIWMAEKSQNQFWSPIFLLAKKDSRYTQW